MVLAPAKPTAAEWLEIQFPEDCALTDELFIQLSGANEDLRFERSPEGALIIVSFPGNESAGVEHEIGGDLLFWRRSAGGHSIGSGARFRMPDGRIMLADAAWFTQEQWDSLGEAQRGPFFPLCPAFVVEVRSPGQSLASQMDKMERWIGYGSRLGWLIDQTSSRVWIYRTDQDPIELQQPAELSGDPELPGLTVDLSRIWI